MTQVDLVSHADLERRLREELTRRRLPDWALYVGDAESESWLDLERDEAFPVARELTDLLEASLGRIAPHLPPKPTVVSIGAGDGRKERLVLEAIRPLEPRGYVPIDISRKMVAAAMDTSADLGVPVTGVVGFCEDLPHLAAEWQRPVVLCLLGNNFANYAPGALLGRLAGSLGPADRLLIDSHVTPEARAEDPAWREQVQAAYRCEANARFNTAPLVARGAPPDACRFELELRRAETPVGPAWRTHKQVVLERDVRLAFGVGGDLDLPAGTTLEMGFTWKYTPRQVVELLAAHGLPPIETSHGPRGEDLLAVARRKKETP
jgi:uncharacterized SAM-dependent methyltransferase